MRTVAHQPRVGVPLGPMFPINLHNSLTVESSWQYVDSPSSRGWDAAGPSPEGFPS